MSLSLLKKTYGTRQDLERQGVWVSPVLDEDHDISFLLARMLRTNKKWAGRVTKVYRQNKRKIDSGMIPDDLDKTMTLRIFCETILLDWRGIKDDKGVDIPYSVDAGMKLLAELPDLHDYLIEEANSATTYQAQAVDEVAGKSASTSAGS